MKQSLNGTWNCTLPDGARHALTIPGCFDTVADRWDIGHAVVHEKTFWYEGKGRARIVFGGVSYACKAWLNGQPLGEHEGMWDTFSMDVTQALRHGDNRLVMEITKPGYSPEDPYPLRQVLSGFIPDVLTTFGGLWDDVTLETAEHYFVVRHSACGNMRGNGEVTCCLDVDEAAKAELTLRVFDPQGQEVFSGKMEQAAEKGENEWVFPLSIPAPQLWSTDSPALYRYELTISLNGQVETITRRFGCREITSQGDRLLLNGKPLYWRGLLHWGVEEEKLCPSYQDDVIHEELTRIQAFGFNAIKHCLYIPRRNYLDLMDELGVLAWVELPLWLPEASDQLNPRIRREYPRLLRQLQGHPSLCLISLGCELDATVDGAVLQEMYHMARNELHALVRDNSGSGECYDGLKVDYADFFDYHFYAELPNLEPLLEAFTPRWRSTRPWLFGEFCDSDTLRDLQPLRKERGVERLAWEIGDPHRNPISILKPDFYADKHDQRMEQRGIREEYELLHRLSAAHSMAHRKVTLEMTRSFGEICGYNITNLRDVPIATSGLLDDQGREKFDPELFSSFNGDVALLPAWDLARVWVGADRVLHRERMNFVSESMYSLHVLGSNYGNREIDGAELRHALRQGGQTLLRGSMECAPLGVGMVSEAGYLQLRLPKVDKPTTLWLEVSLEAEQSLCQNVFPIFMYPKHEPIVQKLSVYDPIGALAGIEKCFDVRFLSGDEPIREDCDVLVTSLLNETARRWMEQGGRTVLVQIAEGSLPVVNQPMWREGMMRAYDHVLMEDIPQREWLDDLRYFSMTTDVAFDTARIPGAKPILRRYDCRQWTVSDYVIELPCKQGKCFATTLRLAGGMGKAAWGIQNNPFAVYLLSRMIGEWKA